MRGIFIFLVFWLVLESTHEIRINDSKDGDINIEQRNELEDERMESKQTDEVIEPKRREFKKECRDLLSDWKCFLEFEDKGRCSGKVAKRLCKETCGLCDSLRKMKKKNQKKQKKLRSIRENSGYRRGSFCEDRLNYAKCNRVFRKGKCVTRKAKKCKKTCGLCGVCADNPRKNCAKQLAKGKCIKKRVQKRCPKTCGLCNIPGLPGPFPVPRTLRNDSDANYESTETDICKQSLETGNCSDSITRWFYNFESNECEQFDYSGCEGNGNNFDSKDDCEIDCKVQFGNDYD